MRQILYRAKDRGSADLGWLRANYTFSFAKYFNPKKLHFGKLRVLNDDVIKGGGGFEKHPHDNMEIISIPLSGTIVHEDNMGNRSEVKTGEVQVMSAGTGIEHSEYNASASKELNLLQIWILPDKKDIQPIYGQKSFDVSKRQNEYQLLVSPSSSDDALSINQKVSISRIDLDAGQKSSYHLKHTNNGVFLMVIDGELSFRNELLLSRDAIGIMDVSQFEVTAIRPSQLLIIDVPMH